MCNQRICGITKMGIRAELFIHLSQDQQTLRWQRTCLHVWSLRLPVAESREGRNPSCLPKLVPVNAEALLGSCLTQSIHQCLSSSFHSALLLQLVGIPAVLRCIFIPSVTNTFPETFYGVFSSALLLNISPLCTYVVQ